MEILESMILIIHLKKTDLRRWALFPAMLEKCRPFFCEVRSTEILVTSGRALVTGKTVSPMFCAFRMGRHTRFHFSSFTFLNVWILTTELKDSLPSLSCFFFFLNLEENCFRGVFYRHYSKCKKAN